MEEVMQSWFVASSTVRENPLMLTAIHGMYCVSPAEEGVRRPGHEGPERVQGQSLCSSLCCIHRCTSPSSESTMLLACCKVLSRSFLPLYQSDFPPSCSRVLRLRPVQDAHIPFDGQGQVLGGQKPMGRAGLRDAMAKAAQRRAQVGVQRSRE